MRYIVKSYLECNRCPLNLTRRSIVFGSGDIPADILFVGEAPDKIGDMRNKALIGPSLTILEKAISFAMKLSGRTAEPTYFITNLVACRPCNSKEDETREPTQSEAWSCWQRLEKTYQDVQPKKVVLLGKIAKTHIRKAWPFAHHLFHPSFILRRGGIESPEFRQLARELAKVFEEIS